MRRENNVCNAPRVPSITSNTTPMTSSTIEHTLAFRLSETHSGADAVRHQRFIELEGPCIASLGTLAGTVVERYRVWHAIDRLGTRRRGWIELGRVDDRLRLEAMEKLLWDWVAKERVDEWSVAQWKEGAQQLLEGTPETSLPQEWKCRVYTGDRDAHDMMLAELRVACGSERGGTGTEGLPVTDRRPRASVVQRRIDLELAPELCIDAQEDIVRRWCESNLAEVSWHACIHRDRDECDAWRDRAYIVYTQFALQVELDEHGWATGWWTFERAGRLPPPAETVNVLWGKGEQGRAGTQALIERWRDSLVALLNEGLAAEGAARRYRTSAHQHDRPSTVAPVQSMRAHGRGGIESSSGEARLRSIAELGAGGVAEPWLEGWRVALTNEPKGQRVGQLAASIVEQWSADEQRWFAHDRRPDVRALCAQARRWRRDTERWRIDVERLCALLPDGEEAMAGVERLMEDLNVHGISLQTVATKHQQSSLGEARWCVQAVTKMDETRTAIESALDEKTIDANVRPWMQASQKAERVFECSACVAAWKKLGDEANQRKLDLRNAVFWATLQSHDGNRPEKLTRVRASLKYALSGSDNGDRDLDLHEALEIAESCDEYILGNDPVVDALKLSVEERIDERRRAIWEAGRTKGVTSEASEQRRRQIAQLAPTDAARWVGRDLEVVKRFEFELWDAVQARLRQFVPVAKRRRTKVIARAEPGEEDRAVAAAFSPGVLAALNSIAPEVAATIADTKSRAEAQDKQVVNELRAAVSKVREARDPRQRSMLRTQLTDGLTNERVRTTLSRTEWMGLARESGLGPMEVAEAVRIAAAEGRMVHR